MIISNPEKPLNPAVEISKTDYYCCKIAPYAIISAIFILFLFVAFYAANVTGSEANILQRLELII